MYLISKIKNDANTNNPNMAINECFFNGLIEVLSMNVHMHMECFH